MPSDNQQDVHQVVNTGDKVADEPQTVEEKTKQLSVDAPDITGDHIQVPTYFEVEEPDGEKKHYITLKTLKRFQT